ncbi:MAG TPA: Hsp70 family protein [Pirellulaceae bacterium]|jgi:molecular chaperone DnaK|nr:Hsp70 family protein [Pirellulaceae bacterium]
MPPVPPPVGIDLGTTFSVIAYIDASGRPQTIPNAEGDIATPSVVLFDGGEPVVGKEAYKAASLEPESVAQFAKREMGSAAFSRTIDGQSYPPEVIQSMILRKLKRDAENVLGPFQDVVITVPAYFTEPRRKATQDAGRLAGLRVIDIINEPTAAAIAYGMQQQFLDANANTRSDEIALIYDLGGGTFDATIMSISGDRFTVLATDGDVLLGGLDWDRALADHVAERFLEKHGVDLRQDAAGYQRLLRESEEAKRALTNRDSYALSIEHRGQGLRVPVDRGTFEELTGNLLDRTRHTVISLVREANLTWDRITRVLLVGGSTRMPMVGRMLEELTGKPVDRSLSADESVAHGAAIYAGIRGGASSRAPAFQITNVNSHNLGVIGFEADTKRPRNEVLIARNSPLPAQAQRRFRLARPDQGSVEVKIVEGGDASGNDATPIGRCVIRNVPGGLPPAARVIVEFSYGTEGRLTVRASIPGYRAESVIEIDRSGGMSGEDLANWSAKLNLPTFDDSVARASDRGEGSIAALDPEQVEDAHLPVQEAGDASYGATAIGSSGSPQESFGIQRRENDAESAAPSESRPSQELTVNERLDRAESVLASGDGAGAVEEAMSHVRAALDEAPDDARALTFAMRLAWSRADVEDALEFAQRVERSPGAREEEKRDACITTGWAYADAGMYEDALDAFKKAVSFDPKSAEALERIAEGHYRLGRHEDACRASRDCLQVDPNSSLCREILQATGAV